jgi:hypothetical protein
MASEISANLQICFKFADWDQISKVQVEFAIRIHVCDENVLVGDGPALLSNAVFR